MKSKRQKREEAEIRHAEYQALSTEQKIARAKAARGKSKKQLERLAKEQKDGKS